jgi:heme exporter protein B
VTWLATAAVVAGKDLRLELRTRDVVSSVGLFALLVVVTASFALPLEGSAREGMAAGVLWMAFLFAGLLGLGRSMTIEDEAGGLDGLLVSPAPREGIFLGKLASNLAFTVAVEALIVPLFIAILQLHVGAPALLIVSIALGTLGILTVGTLFAAIAVGTRGREAILPLLVLPVSVPIVTAAVKTTEFALKGTWGGAPAWLLLMIGFDALFVLVALATFPYVTEG